MPVVGYCRNPRLNLCPCFVCGKKFSLDNGIEDLLTHICFTHRIIIENVDCIANFLEYMEYYTRRLQKSPLENFTKSFTIEIPEKDSESKLQKYHLLGGLPEDEALRKRLHSERLKAAQKQQRKDLSNYYYERHCFYCHQTMEVTNISFIHHLKSHGFHLGHPEKLVYIERFIEAIEDNFRNLQCLYCENRFETCRALIKHMTEKNHQKIHPSNRFYDQFYMINYVEYGKTWLDFAKEKQQTGDFDLETEEIEDLDWASWGSEPEYIVCLFCKHICRSWDGTLLHLQVSHNFDFKAQISHLKFYDQVKVVNYIRRRMSDRKCLNCDYSSENETDLTRHMEINKHLSIPETETWDLPEYYYCAMENDMFLFHLEDDDNDGITESAALVKGTPNILRQIEIDNFGSESTDGSNADICSLDNREIDIPDKDSENRENFPSENVQIKIRHRDNDSNFNINTDSTKNMPKNTIREKPLLNGLLDMPTINVGAGDFVSKIKVCGNSLLKNVSELGDVGNKNIL